ncbi:hypothetical protein EGT07_03035 [Herbaspirillum sp. HC18]|nr:hypothetical protein EGT07_03035 [Herbaspirillum sp. HC18]
MILFLDFDGVLHPFDHPAGVFVLLPDFERVMRDFRDVDIVISSAWRELHPLPALKSLFSPDIRRRIIGATPVFNGMDHPYIREAEILAWLRETGRENEAWLAIDDTDWFFSPDCSNLVLVNPDTGFNDDTERALRRRLAAE